MHTTMQIFFESIVLNERNQSQNTIYCMILVYEISGTGESIKTENDLLTAQERDKR